MSTDSRTKLGLQGVAIEGERGGALAFHPEADTLSVDPVQPSEYGVALGPLEVMVYDGTTVGVKRTEFLTGRGDSEVGDDTDATPWFGSMFVAGLGGLNATDRDDGEDEDNEAPVGRREFLKAATAATGAFGLAANTVAETDTLPVAEVDVMQNPGGFRLRIHDLVEAVLPAHQTYHVTLDGTRLRSFKGDGVDGVTVGPGEVGTVSVHTDSDARWYENIKALVQNNVLTYDFGLDRKASAYETGSDLVITEHPVVVEALRKADTSESTFTVGDVSIAHVDEDSTYDAGTYGVDEGDDGVPPAVVYTAGPDAPDSKNTELNVRVGRIDEVLDDINRRV